MKKRWLIGVLAAAMTAGALSMSAAAAESRPLEVWVRNSFYDRISDSAKAFTEKTGIEVNVTEPSDMSDDLALALTSGTAPDVVSIDCVLAPYYASVGALLDITDRFEAMEYKDTFSGGTLDLAKYEGKQYALPFCPDVSVLLWNKEIFKEAGLDPDTPPTTWEELIADAQACTNDDHWGYVYGAGDGGTMMFTFCPYIWSNGGDFTTEDGSASALDSPEAIAALQLIHDMIYEYHVTPETITSYGWTEAEDAFKSQKAAMISLGHTAATAIFKGEYDFDAGVALIPAADGKTFSSFSGGDSIAIISSTTMPDEAWQFLEYCMSEDVQVEQLAANGDLPARSDFFDNEYFAQYADIYNVLKEALAVGKAPYSLKYNEMYTPWLDAIQFALNEEKTPEEAFKDAKAEMDDILSE